MNLFKKFWHKTLKRPYKLTKVWDTGQGQPVLLIHGLGASAATWKPFVELADKKKWHLLGYDLLGFGQSPKPRNNSYSVRDHSRSTIASLDKKYRKEEIIIIGHSMGCLIASHIAKHRPQYVKRLILYEPPLFADSPEFRSHARRKRLYFALYEEIARHPRLMLAYFKALARFEYGRSVAMNQSSWTAFERSLRNTIMKQEAYDELETASVPTDIIYGKFDFIVTRKEVKDMLKANPNIKFHLVNEMHDVTKRSSRYILSLLGSRTKTTVKLY